MEPARTAYRNDHYTKPDFYEWIESRFVNGKELSKRVKEAEDSGRNVYYGQLSSDRGQVEGFFCTDSFIIDTEKLYIDAVQSGW